MLLFYSQLHKERPGVALEFIWRRCSPMTVFLLICIIFCWFVICIILNCVSGPVGRGKEGQSCVWRTDIGYPSISPALVSSGAGRPWLYLIQRFLQMGPKEIRAVSEKHECCPKCCCSRICWGQSHRSLHRVTFQSSFGSRASCPGLKVPAAVAPPEEVSDTTDRATLTPILSTTNVRLVMGQNSKVVPVKVVPVFAVVASVRAGVQGCFSPRAPLSTSLLPEDPAKAALVQEDS